MYKFEVGERHGRDAYNDALRSVLEIPSLEDESSGATRVVRCLLMPSFHPECSISIVERDAIHMTVRTAGRSVWALTNARQGSSHGNLVTDWVKPAVSAERIVMAEAAAPWQPTIDEIEHTAPDDGQVWGLDGMRVDVLLWRPGTERAFGVWFGQFDETDRCHRLVRTVLDTALKLATWNQSVANLEAAARYLDR